MATSSGSLEYWRKFFRSARSDIFGVIEQAVVVAASDHPQEFRSRRDLMVERFYAVLLPRCFGCDRVDIGRAAAAATADDGVKRETEKESKVDSSSDAPEDLNRAASNNSYNEADALTEEIQEEMDITGKVSRIKTVLERFSVEEERVLFESLRQLQALQLSFEVLKTTEIGKTVNILRKHSSKQIRRLVRTLIESWKVVVDQWVNTRDSNTENSSHSLNPSMVDDDGLPSASLDDGPETTTSVEFTKSSFSGVDDDDDDENFRTVRKQQPPQYLSPEEGEIGGEEPRQPLIEGRTQMRRQEQRFAKPLEKGNLWREEPIMRISKQQGTYLMHEKPELMISRHSNSMVSDSGPGRPPKFPTTRKAGNEMNSQRQQEVAMIQRKPPVVPQDKPKNSEEKSVKARLEVSKRKFHQENLQAENAKKQRTIQVRDLQEISKQAHNRVQPTTKSSNIIRNSAYGRQQFSYFLNFE